MRSLPTDSGQVVTAVGEIDLASAPLLETEAEKHQGVDVVIDLTRVEFIDSAGLVVLIRQQERIRSSGAELTLAVSPGPVTRLLELTGLSGAFPIISVDGIRRPD
ncbi:MAG: STAS domain-containing protein [Acidimicrobiia bacterium]